MWEENSRGRFLMIHHSESGANNVELSAGNLLIIELSDGSIIKLHSETTAMPKITVSTYSNSDASYSTEWVIPFKLSNDFIEKILNTDIIKYISYRTFRFDI